MSLNGVNGRATLRINLLVQSWICLSEVVVCRAFVLEHCRVWSQVRSDCRNFRLLEAMECVSFLRPCALLARRCSMHLRAIATAPSTSKNDVLLKPIYLDVQATTPMVCCFFVWKFIAPPTTGCWFLLLRASFCRIHELSTQCCLTWWTSLVIHIVGLMNMAGKLRLLLRRLVSKWVIFFSGHFLLRCSSSSC